MIALAFGPGSEVRRWGSWLSMASFPTLDKNTLRLLNCQRLNVVKF
jgi:hypothetical protein